MMRASIPTPAMLWPEPYDQLSAQDRREMWEAYRYWYGMDADLYFARDHGMKEHEACILHEESTERDGTNCYPKGE